MSSGLDRESRRFYRKESQTDLTKFWDGGEHYASRNRWCFECAWECANKGKTIKDFRNFDFLFCNNIVYKVRFYLYIGIFS